MSGEVADFCCCHLFSIANKPGETLFCLELLPCSEVPPLYWFVPLIWFFDFLIFIWKCIRTRGNCDSLCVQCPWRINPCLCLVCTIFVDVNHYLEIMLQLWKSFESYANGHSVFYPISLTSDSILKISSYEDNAKQIIVECYCCNYLEHLPLLTVLYSMLAIL